MKFACFFFLLFCCVLPPGALRARAAARPASSTPTPAESNQPGICARCHSGTGRPSNAGCHAASQDFQKFHLFDNIESCTLCHIGGHGQDYRQECADCHDAEQWRPAPLTRFNHQTQTKYPLAGRHTALVCEDCHKKNQFPGTPADCGACHQNPHEGRFAKRCAECHPQTGFHNTTLIFDHNRHTRFPLTGLHAGRDCSLCHADLGYRVRGVTCATCHTEVEEFYAGTLFYGIVDGAPDPLHGRVKCQDCHKPTDKNAEYEVVRARYAGLHEAKDATKVDEIRKTLAERIKRMQPTVAQDPTRKSMMETIQRLGMHNPDYAGKLLDALEKPVKGGHE